MAQLRRSSPSVPLPSVEPLTLARAVVRAAESRQGEAVQVLDISQVSSFADYFVIVSGGNERHVKALYEAMLDEALKLEVRPHHVEGETEGRWILVDFVDVVVHVFVHDLRSFYNIDRLWADAPEVQV